MPESDPVRKRPVAMPKAKRARSAPARKIGLPAGTLDLLAQALVARLKELSPDKHANAIRIQKLMRNEQHMSGCTGTNAGYYGANALATALLEEACQATHVFSIEFDKGNNAMLKSPLKSFQSQAASTITLQR